MIISVNATVCVIGTRVSDQRFMIILSSANESELMPVSPSHLRIPATGFEPSGCASVRESRG
jgi:hypothetical protein